MQHQQESSHISYNTQALEKNDPDERTRHNVYFYGVALATLVAYALITQVLLDAEGSIGWIILATVVLLGGCPMCSLLLPFLWFVYSFFF